MMLLLLMLLVVDTDECAAGGEAELCKAELGGVCEGHLPDEKFICTCQPGYVLEDTGVRCIGLYERHVSHLVTDRQTDRQ